MLDFFEIRSDGRMHPLLYQFAFGCFALSRCWDARGLTGPQRGRAFEEALYRYCERTGMEPSERAGSRTLRDAGSASGFHHESDAVIAAADVTIHLETKHLSLEVSKNDLLVFNQKGIDFLLGDDLQLRRRPLYRMFVSGTPLRPEARRFALLWGIITIEPDRLPLPLLHWLAGSSLPPIPGLQYSLDRIWQEIPQMVVSAQERLQRAAACLDNIGEAVSRSRLDHISEILQVGDGARIWATLDGIDPLWLERVFETTGLQRMTAP
jgi:hypothetical protein